MRRRPGIGIALALLFAFTPRAADAAQLRGLGGPEQHKVPAKKKFPGLRKPGDKAKPVTEDAVPKGALRPGQGPFPNLGNAAAEGRAPAKN